MHEWQFIGVYIWFARMICHFHLGNMANPDRYFGSSQPVLGSDGNLIHAESQLAFAVGFAQRAGGLRFDAVKTLIGVMELPEAKRSLKDDERTMDSHLEARVETWSSQLKSMVEMPSLAALEQQGAN